LWGGTRIFVMGQFEIVAKKARSSPLPPASRRIQHIICTSGHTAQSLPNLQVPNCLLFMRFLAFLPLNTNSYDQLIQLHAYLDTGMKSKRFGICSSTMMFTNEPTQRNPSWHCSHRGGIPIDRLYCCRSDPTRIRQTDAKSR